ncbi:hypothetical protein [Microtetraspora sp. NBRC 16547]|uniref:hypothetical protein n=1 Tax=Microtetraspora sp. NBRC 16547 TaxID=3030993 RepID=UPI0024A48B66|nr:hypothetical protein [Microtetraspora sp. NBRC 16547]GLW96038.1 hypothetical protein Misp02_01250 [Microtetraspora sp. NBRC 16547]
MLAAGSAMPALALAGWLLAGLPLLLLGWFRPLPMALLGGGTAVLLCWYGLRRLPETVDALARHTAAVIGIALASGLFNGFLHGEQLLVRRDPATYAQYAIWMARHGSLPIPYGDGAFGGPDPALRFDSMGFYDFHGAIVPQFMPGPPMLDGIGYWLGGVPGLLLVPPVLGALAVLVFAGTVARLAGGRWAPLAALVFAVSMPILYTSRTTFSEIPSLILLFGGMTLLLDARRRLRAGSGALTAAGLAGLVFGLALLVRIDGLRDVLPVLAYAGLLIALRRISGPPSPELARPDPSRRFPDGRLGAPLLAGLAVGGFCGFAACYLLARPYLEYLSGSLLPLLAICAAVVVVTAVGTALAPRIAVRVAARRASQRRSGGVTRRLPGARRWPRLPEWSAALVVLVMAGFAVRPWLQTVRRVAVTQEDQLTADFIQKAQMANRLPVDGTRLYYEDSLYWVIWYVGVPVVVLATIAAAVLARRLARGRGLEWLLPLAIIGWTTVTTLWRPAITPDHPFAARRLVPVVIPGLILLAVWGLRWARDRLRITGRGTRLAMTAGVLLLVVPPVVTSIGTAFSPVERGEAAAIARMCAAIPRDASVLIVERVTGDRFTQLVRGQCGIPTARIKNPKGSSVALGFDVRRLIGEVRETGRRPVLVAAQEDQLAPYGTATQVLRLDTTQDERSLADPPDAVWSLKVDVWMVEPR